MPAQEDQSGLTVGQYTVVVTDQTASCQQTAVFNVIGPGGCAVCPVVGTITSNPTPTTCINSTVSLNASGLTFMGVTYGIEFKYSNTPLADPYIQVVHRLPPFLMEDSLVVVPAQQQVLRLVQLVTITFMQYCHRFLSILLAGLQLLPSFR